MLCESHLGVVGSLVPQPKSAVIKRDLHPEWRLLVSQRSQDTQALLGQVTGSVSVNKPAVHVGLEPAGCWSACVNFRVLQGLAVSIVVTTAEPRCLMGRHAVTPAAVMSTQQASRCSALLFFLSSSTWRCDSSLQSAATCEKSSPAFVRVSAQGKRQQRHWRQWQLAVSVCTSLRRADV